MSFPGPRFAGLENGTGPPIEKPLGAPKPVLYCVNMSEEDYKKKKNRYLPKPTPAPWAARVVAPVPPLVWGYRSPGVGASHTGHTGVGTPETKPAGHRRIRARIRTVPRPLPPSNG